MSLDRSKLECVKTNSDGSIQVACPICRAGGGDRTGNHLRIWSSGAFSCIVGGDDRVHNKAIRAILRGEEGALNEVEFIAPVDKLTVDKVYPEASLSALLKDHTYWLKRGAKPHVMDMLEGGLAPVNQKGALSNRYVIPIRGMTSQINGYSGRILNYSTYAPKYKHMFKSSKVCWPWHLSGPSIIKTRVVVLQEGWSEWIALAGGDIMNSLSLFGLNLSSTMIGQLVAARVKKVVISTNANDENESEKLKKGTYKAHEIKEKLHNFFAPEDVIIRQPKTDWGEAMKNGDEGARQIAAFRAELETLYTTISTL